ncbi:MAG: PKD domain-containing protein [Bacteroidota bacterium]
MRKIFTLLFSLTVLYASAFARPDSTCNPAFSFTVDNATNTVQFAAVAGNTSVMPEHSWSFGDGSGFSGVFFPNPSHYYANAGTYHVVHVITYRSPNDSTIILCSDSASQLVTIANQAPCNLQANFFVTRDSTYPNIVYFNNTSTGVTSNMSIHWDFGDGTSTSSINEYSTTHIYQQSGTYTVCFSVRRDNSCSADTCKVIEVQVPTTTCNLVVNFSNHADSANPQLMHFTDQSTPQTVGLDSLQWSFGDGTGSMEENPSHFYTQAGTYTVCLRIKRANGVLPCIREYCRTIVIAPQPQPCNVHASFSFVRDSIQPNKVYFTNLSSGINPNTITYWSFGDGASSYDQNPTHIFTTSGAYTVCLNVKRDNVCMDDTCVFVQVQAPTGNCNNLLVNFSNLSDSANSRLVHFVNQSTPLSATDSVTWHFGDGTISHDLTAVNHTYANSGTYLVCLVVKKNGNSTGAACVREYCRQIIIEPACNLVASFTFQPAIITVPLSYTFTNTSAPLHNVDSSFWNFGDGSPVIINPDNRPTHTYRTPGVYVVCLTVKKVQPGTINIICERQTCQTIIIDTPQTQCNLQAYFMYTPDSVSVNRIIFSNMSSSYEPSDSLLWTFGDGSYSTEVSPEHTYNAGGTYNVCLRIERHQTAGTTPCVREYCRQVLVQQPATCNLVANFFDSSINNNSIYFINQSTPLASSDSIRWTFGDGTSSVDVNPTHTYNQPGTYTVCLRVKKAQTNSTAPCVREICHTVVIQPSTTCNLIANFEYVSDSANVNANVYHFYNTSTPISNIDSSFWNFGDGAPVQFNPNNPVTHTYAAPGTYVVCLFVKKVIPGSTSILCERQVCKTIVVAPSPNACDQLQANFSWHADPANNRKILFTNQSSPLNAPTYSIWTFGDGTNSTALNPEHIYTQPGTYTACLKMGILNEPCFKDTCKIVVVLPGGVDSCNFHPGFITHIDSANRRKVLFTNTTMAPTSAAFAVWNFGDGTSSTGWNADHIYTAPGWYLVCLTVRSGNNTTCTRTYCDSLFVPGNVIPPYNCDTFQLNFGYRRDDYMPNKLFFFATGNAPVYNQQWTFTNNANGAPITVNQNNPVYVFPDTGSYRVCVRAAFSTNCIKENCDWIRINSTTVPTQCVLNSYPNPAHSIVTFNVHLDQAGVIAATVLNMQGVTLMQYTQTGFTGNNPVTLNIQNLAPGFYTVRIMYGGRVCYTRFQKI